jgi:hypothetical protein
MPQIFPPAANTWSKLSIVAAVVLMMASGWLGLTIVRSPYVTRAQVVRDQPVPFSHKHHVQQVGLDCRYCHASVDRSPFAGMPATEVCLGCHAHIWADSPMLAAVRESQRQQRPIAWTRVHDLPDFVHFDHSIHVAQGVGCTTCHGHVEEMPLMWREATLHMDWCLGCHRHPERYVRPRDQVFSVSWPPVQPAQQEPSLRDQSLVKNYGIDDPVQLTNCSRCHQ